MFSLLSKSLILCIVFLVSIESQIVRRQYITDSQQIQVPVRRINIPYEGRKTGEQRPDSIDRINRQCPECPQKRLVQHYMARGCTPVIKGGCDCPSRYECPTSARLTNSSKVCWFKGKAYPLGATIVSENRCRSCKCDSIGEDVQINCFSGIRCPALTSEAKADKRCYSRYSHNQCCPRYDCPTARSANKVCNYRGIQYRIEEKIAVEENRCMSCICSEEWDDKNPLDRYSCRSVECDLELDPMFRSGCTPVYAEEHCCPIDYNCPKSSRLSIRGVESGSLMCDFETRKYPIGSTLYTDNRCVQCICQIPPQFTCIERKDCK